MGNLPPPLWTTCARLSPPSWMARPGHARNHSRLEEAGAEDAEDPLDSIISQSGCREQHQELQLCMAERKDWRQCQNHLRAFGDCMAQQNRAKELGKGGTSRNQTHPTPTGD
ncbi:cytochrome c oxidase assembly factor 4 homolog, mitochondrial isoform X2 [Heliangelus exortis]